MQNKAKTLVKCGGVWSRLVRSCVSSVVLSDKGEGLFRSSIVRREGGGQDDPILLVVSMGSDGGEGRGILSLDYCRA